MKKLINASKTFFKNIAFLLKNDLSEESQLLHKSKKDCEKNTKEISKLLFNQIDFWYDLHKELSLPIKDELKFFRTTGKISAFPYPAYESENNIESGFDVEKNLPFVIHNGKRLYFSKNFTEQKAVEKYKYYLYRENLLGIENMYEEDMEVVVDSGRGGGGKNTS